MENTNLQSKIYDEIQIRRIYNMPCKLDVFINQANEDIELISGDQNEYLADQNDQVQNQIDNISGQVDLIQEQHHSIAYSNPLRPCYQWNKNHPPELIIGKFLARLRTRNQMINELLQSTCISQLEPKKINEALIDSN